MIIGKVKWFSQQKECGFISSSDGNKDIFIHIWVSEKSEIASLN